MVQHAAFKQSKQCHGYDATRTSAFPKLRPCSMPMKAGQRIFEAFGDVLAIADAPIGDSSTDGAQDAG
jgi:hypothetical protein